MRPNFMFFLTMFLPCSVSGDVQVSCVFWESCVLPCAFTPGDDPVIHWTKEPGDIPVHNYYYNKHQLHLQHESYRNRTSLSDQGIRTGDASLQLQKVNVGDEGRYKCYVNTRTPDKVKESFVNLKVHHDNNVLCIWKQTCTLPCPFQGEFQEASWSRVDSQVPIIVKPPGQWYLHINYRNIVSMPEGGAALEIRGVELKHQGLHRCSVTSRTGEINRFIFLSVHAPVLDVSVRQEGQQLICSSERIYPEPKVDWTPPSSDSYQTQTSRTEDGLYTVYSSVRLSPNSTAESLTCNVSTPYSWSNATVPTQPPDNHNLHYLWIPLILIPVAVCFLISCYRWKITRYWNKSQFVEPAQVPLNDCKIPLKDPKRNDDDESGVSTELNETSTVHESTPVPTIHI